MGKNGLSPLQIDIMAVLDEFPALEEVPRGNLSSWAFPKDILTALRRPRFKSSCDIEGATPAIRARARRKGKWGGRQRR